MSYFRSYQIIKLEVLGPSLLLKNFTDNELAYLPKAFSKDTPMQLISWAGDKNHPQFSMTLANWGMQGQ